jgi:hypothetical protein
MNELRRVWRAIEEIRRLFANLPVRWPAPGGTGGRSEIRVRITERNGYDLAAVYATSHPNGLLVVKVDDDDADTGDEFTAFVDDNFVGVTWTDRIVRAERRGAETFIIEWGVENWWDAFTGEAIDIDEFGDVQLFSNGPTVQATTRTGIGIDTFCRAFFDTEAQLFYLLGQDCPATP